MKNQISRRLRPLAHPKKRGEWVELQFMARAAQHGLSLSKPWGDCNRYDFIAEHKGNFHRVQVKSTLQFSRGRGGRRDSYMCNTVSRPPSRKNGGNPYTPQDIDFFALYIIPEDIWYIVPMTIAKRALYAVTLAPHHHSSKYFKYMEAWHLLKSGKK